jgi:GNAT superfamily N-acetyltransferase
MTIRFTDLTALHAGEATALVLDATRREMEHVPCLPAGQLAGAFEKTITHAVTNGTGVAAMDGGSLVGFMAFYGPIDRLFGNARGAISPLHGHAMTGNNREWLTSMLFQHAAERIVARGMTSLAIALYAHDKAAASALSLLGFGIRNADAIRDLDLPLDVAAADGYTFTELGPGEVMAVHPLENGLIRHLRSSPTFLPVSEMSEETFREERSRDARFFAARAGSETVGYLKVSDEGENILTTAPDMLNITGAFLLPEHRGRGVYDALLAYAIDTLRSEGVRRLGVDFETMNPAARHFWGRYFVTYTHSFVRRIDDGILEDPTT